MWKDAYSVQGSARDFMYKVYGWMSVALVVTAMWHITLPPLLLSIQRYLNRPVFY